jgi:hypothetical protein
VQTEEVVARHALMPAALRVLCLCMCAVLLSGDVLAIVVWVIRLFIDKTKNLKFCALQIRQSEY